MIVLKETKVLFGFGVVVMRRDLLALGVVVRMILAALLGAVIMMIILFYKIRK